MHSLKVKDQLLNEDLEEFNPSIAMKMAVAESLTRNSQLFLPLQANEIQQREKYYEVPRTEKEKRSWRSRNAKKTKKLKRHDRLEHVWRYHLNREGAYYDVKRRNLYYPGSNEPIPLDPFDGSPLYPRNYHNLL
ncbi:hypothetical protein HDV02_004135 [Globomyces sp. JEL0801]|nr:hypothetical protein HDV02_004135 [Globomyces sp. JEL0801]